MELLWRVAVPGGGTAAGPARLMVTFPLLATPGVQVTTGLSLLPGVPQALDASAAVDRALADPAFRGWLQRQSPESRTLPFAELFAGAWRIGLGPERLPGRRPGLLRLDAVSGDVLERLLP